MNHAQVAIAVALLVSGLFPATAGATRLFRANFSSYLSSSQHRWHAIAADLDADGKDDLLTTTWQSNVRGLEVRRSGPGPELSPDVTIYPIGHGGFLGLVTTADLDADGQLDVLVTDIDSLEILPGLGGGALGAVQRLSVPQCGEGFCAVADLNGDGHADIVVAHQYADKVTVLWGDGAFGFTSGPEFATASSPYFVGIADLNGDSKPDVVVGAIGSATVLLADGQGGFLASSVAADQAFVAGDLNGDGHVDLAAIGGILLGQGDGTFGSPIPHGIARPWLTADLNEDGRLDLLGLSGSPLNLVLSQLGHGDGTFGPVQRSVAYTDAWTLAAGDFDNDGHVDVAKATYTNIASMVHHGLGNGAFENAPFFAAGLRPLTLALGKLNGDAIPDIVMGSYLNRFIAVLRSTGPAAYETPLLYPVPVGQRLLQVADLNGDGRDDVVTATDSSAIVSIWLAQPDGSLGARSAYTLPGAVRDFVLADLDLDGDMDLVYHYSDLPPAINFGSGFATGAGDGTFGPPNTLAYVLGNPILAADMNGDGLPDLIGHSSGHNPRIAFATAPLAYPSFIDLEGFYFISAMAVGRWDADAIPDLMIQSDSLKVFRGLGGGAFAPPHVISEVPAGVVLKTWTDMNGDGLSDVVGTAVQSGVVCLGQPGDTFAPPVGAGVGGSAVALAVGDVDGNGRPDMVVATNSVSGGLDLRRATLLLNQLDTPNVGVTPRTEPTARLKVHASPNPARGRIRLALEGRESSPAKVELMDVSGRVMKSVVLPVGARELVIGPEKPLVPGLYFTRVRRGGEVVQGRICVIR